MISYDNFILSASGFVVYSSLSYFKVFESLTKLIEISPGVAYNGAEYRVRTQELGLSKFI
jgi:hypothetical protein